MKIRSSVIAAAIVAFSSVPSFAASSASASIGPLTLQLVDRDLQDGVTPWITFADVGANNFVRAIATEHFTRDQPEAGGVWAWAPITASGATRASRALATITGALELSGVGATLLASGSASNYSDAIGRSVTFNAFAHGPYGSDRDYGLGFTLSAHTELVISGAASIQLAGAGGFQFDGAGYRQGDSAQAVAQMLLLGPGSNGSGSQEGVDFLSRNDNNVANGFDHQESRVLSVSFVNLTSAAMSGSFVTNVSASGETFASPPGSSADAPLMPGQVLTNPATGAPTFVFPVTPVRPGTLLWIDPPVAVGYDYSLVDASATQSFQSVVIGAHAGDDLFDVQWYSEALGTTQSATVATGEELQLTGGARSFSITGIEAEAQVDPANPLAFVTGLSFAEEGSVSVSQSALVIDYNPLPVPEPGTYALMLAGLVALCLRVVPRRR